MLLKPVSNKEHFAATAAAVFGSVWRDPVVKLHVSFCCKFWLNYNHTRLALAEII